MSVLFVGSARSDIASATGTVEPAVTCTAVPQGDKGRVWKIECTTSDGTVIPPGDWQNIELPAPSPVVSYVPTEIPVPGPTVRITKHIQKIIKVPQPGKTVTLPPVPGPTQTQTIRVPGPTRTEFIRRPQRTVTASPSTILLPVKTVTQPPVTETISVPGPTQTVTRQAKTPRGTIIRKEPPEPFGIPMTDTIIQRVGLGLLALTLLAGLILLGLWMGYAIGYKDRERSEAQFLQALRQQLVGRSLDK